MLDQYQQSLPSPTKKEPRRNPVRLALLATMSKITDPKVPNSLTANPTSKEKANARKYIIDDYLVIFEGNCKAVIGSGNDGKIVYVGRGSAPAEDERTIYLLSSDQGTTRWRLPGMYIEVIPTRDDGPDDRRKRLFDEICMLEDGFSLPRLSFWEWHEGKRYSLFTAVQGDRLADVWPTVQDKATQNRIAKQTAYAVK